MSPLSRTSTVPSKIDSSLSGLYISSHPAVVLARGLGLLCPFDFIYFTHSFLNVNRAQQLNITPPSNQSTFGRAEARNDELVIHMLLEYVISSILVAISAMIMNRIEIV
jgi:hypothetical protein